MEAVSPLVSIIMGSSSDLPVMEEAANFLEQMQVPFEIKILSAHRTPDMVKEHVSGLRQRGVKIVIAGAGGAAHLPGVIAGYTTLPVVGVPIKASISIDGWDSILSILQMPPGIPVATVGLNAARNAAIMAVQILALEDGNMAQRLELFRQEMREKIVIANEQVKNLKYKYLID